MHLNVTPQNKADPRPVRISPPRPLLFLLSCAVACRRFSIAIFYLNTFSQQAGRVRVPHGEEAGAGRRYRVHESRDCMTKNKLWLFLVLVFFVLDRPRVKLQL